jgi:hypothetical protein
VGHKYAHHEDSRHLRKGGGREGRKSLCKEGGVRSGGVCVKRGCEERRRYTGCKASWRGGGRRKGQDRGDCRGRGEGSSVAPTALCRDASGQAVEVRESSGVRVYAA